MPRGATAKRWIADDWGEVAAIVCLLIGGLVFAFFMKAVVVLVLAIGGGAALAVEYAICRRPGARDSEVLQSGVRETCGHIFLSYGMVEEQRRNLTRISNFGPQGSHRRRRGEARCPDTVEGVRLAAARLTSVS